MADSFIESIAAETHPAAYMLHKYWSRKPHNVLNAVFKRFENRGLFLDPFCGSGVALSEASALGYECMGADVNPVARKLTELTLTPVDSDDFVTLVSKLLDEVENKFGHVYMVGREPNSLRYATHTTVVKCACGTLVDAKTTTKDGRRYLCPKCGGRVNLNLENLYSTRIVGVTSHSHILVDDESCTAQELLSKVDFIDSKNSKYDYLFPANRRTLAFPGMRTRHLFTPRNFSCLSHLADEFHKIENNKLKDAALLLLTSTVAQCSRLIASRNGLATGGQAWTVPGFWVPPVHLETNPLSHIRTRLGKFAKGLTSLGKMPNRQGNKWYVASSAYELLNGLKNQSKKAELVFLDPPYGDSVPYVEFSALWNSFLGDMPDPNQDISVSDRDNKIESWQQYQNTLGELVGLISNILLPNGSIVITFNNKDTRAWKTILLALQNAELRTTHVAYQHPAVVSAKAQLAPDGSYVGDFYCILQHGASSPSRDLSSLQKALRSAAIAHSGVITESLLQRVAITEFLRSNIAADLIDEISNIINQSFSIQDGGKCKWLGDIPTEFESIEDAIVRITRGLIGGGRISLRNAYASIVGELGMLGVPDPALVTGILEKHFLIRDEIIIASGAEKFSLQPIGLPFD